MAISPLTTGINDPKLIKALRRLEQDMEKRTPYASSQYVTVTFNAIANNDTIITHDLVVEDPENIDYEVVRWQFASAPGTAPVAYVDSGGSRRAWGEGYIVLRCNVGSAKAQIRLSVRTP